MSTVRLAQLAALSAFLMVALSDLTAEYSWLVVPALALALIAVANRRGNDVPLRSLLREVGVYLGFLVIGVPIALGVVVLVAFAI